MSQIGKKTMNKDNRPWGRQIMGQRWSANEVHVGGDLVRIKILM